MLHESQNARFWRLADRACDGELTETDLRELESLLRESAELQSAYFSYCRLHAEAYLKIGAERAFDSVKARLANSTADAAAASASDRSAGTAKAAPRSPLAAVGERRLYSLGAAALAVLMLVAAMAYFRLPGGGAAAPQVHHADPAPPAPIVARVMKTAECEWRQPGSVARGSALRAGESLELRAGVAELKFKSGAVVLIEGPAKFKLESPGRGVLGIGKLYARVPRQAVGFRIGTPLAEVIDLGTEFGVRVDGDGVTEVQMFQGRVEVQTTEEAEANSGGIILREGRARIVPGGRVIVDPNAEPLKFADRVPTPLELVAYYTFEENSDDTSGNGRHGKPSGHVKYGEGRDGRALSLSGDARGYVDLPIDASARAMPEMTWGAWIRPTEFRLHQHAILSNDDGEWDRQLGLDLREGDRYRFSLRDDGEQVPEGHRLALFGGPENKVATLSETEVRLDRWMFVAATHDQETGEMILYAEDFSGRGGEGQLVWRTVQKARSGPSKNFICVGNHPVNRATDRAEPFVGEIDNVFVVRGVLGAKQLETIREGGIPSLLTLFAETAEDGNSSDDADAVDGR